MIAPDILIQDIDAEGWTNLVSLADPDVLRRLAGEHPRPRRQKARLFVIFEGGNVLKAYHSEKGSILDGFKWSGPDDIEIVAHRENVHTVAAIERNSLGRIYSRFQRNLDMRDDYVKQILEIYESIRDEVGNGLYFYPTRKLIPIDFDKIRKAFRFGVHDNSTILLYLFDGNDVWASLIIGVKDGDVNFVTSHDALAAQGVYIYNWRNDYKKILSASRRLFSKPSVGIFCDVGTCARVLRARKPLKALNEARKAKDVILDPLPMLLKTALGAGRFFI